MVALGVCELCRCWAMGLGIGPICRRWRGCAEVAKTTSSQASGHCGKTKRTPLSENIARLVRRVLLSSDVQFICIDVLVFSQAGLENGHSSSKSLKLINCGPDVNKWGQFAKLPPAKFLCCGVKYTFQALLRGSLNPTHQ